MCLYVFKLLWNGKLFFLQSNVVNTYIITQSVIVNEIGDIDFNQINTLSLSRVHYKRKSLSRSLKSTQLPCHTVQ